MRRLAKSTLDDLLHGQRDITIPVRVEAVARTNALLIERAGLHDLATRNDLRLVNAADVNSGSLRADQLAAAFINFVIARNYAAHHDALDADLIYPTDGGPADHPGHVILSHILTVTVETLSL